MMTFREWQILHESFGGNFNLGLKTPQSLGAVGSRYSEGGFPPPEAEEGDDNGASDLMAALSGGGATGGQMDLGGDEMGDEMGGDPMGGGDEMGMGGEDDLAALLGGGNMGGNGLGMVSGDQMQDDPNADMSGMNVGDFDPHLLALLGLGGLTGGGMGGDEEGAMPPAMGGGKPAAKSPKAPFPSAGDAEEGDDDDDDSEDVDLDDEDEEAADKSAGGNPFGKSDDESEDSDDEGGNPFAGGGDDEEDSDGDGESDDEEDDEKEFMCKSGCNMAHMKESTQVDTDFFNSLVGMGRGDNHKKFTSGLEQDPQPGQVGYAPVGRLDRPAQEAKFPSVQQFMEWKKKQKK